MAYNSTRTKLLGRKVHDNQEETTSAMNSICSSRRITSIGYIRLRFVRGWQFGIQKNLHERYLGRWGQTLRDWSKSPKNFAAKKIHANRSMEKLILWGEKTTWRLNQIRLGAEPFFKSESIFADFCVSLFIFGFQLEGFVWSHLRDAQNWAHIKCEGGKAKPYYMNPKYAIVIKEILE